MLGLRIYFIAFMTFNPLNPLFLKLVYKVLQKFCNTPLLNGRGWTLLHLKQRSKLGGERPHWDPGFAVWEKCVECGGVYFERMQKSIVVLRNFHSTLLKVLQSFLDRVYVCTPLCMYICILYIFKTLCKKHEH